MSVFYHVSVFYHMSVFYRINMQRNGNPHAVPDRAPARRGQPLVRPGASPACPVLAQQPLLPLVATIASQRVGRDRTGSAERARATVASGGSPAIVMGVSPIPYPQRWSSWTAAMRVMSNSRRACDSAAGRNPCCRVSSLLPCSAPIPTTAHITCHAPSM